MNGTADGKRRVALGVRRDGGAGKCRGDRLDREPVSKNDPRENAGPCRLQNPKPSCWARSERTAACSFPGSAGRSRMSHGEIQGRLCAVLPCRDGPPAS
jgi:hypothetical protein